MKTGACRQPLLLESAGLDRERGRAPRPEYWKAWPEPWATRAPPLSWQRVQSRSLRAAAPQVQVKRTTEKTVRDNKPRVIFASGSWIASCCYWNVSRPAPGPPPPRYQC